MLSHYTTCSTQLSLFPSSVFALSPFHVHHQALNDIDTVDIAIDDLAGIARLGGKIVIDALQSKVVIPDFAKFKKGPFHTPYASMFAAVCHWVESTASAHPADVCG